MVHCGVIKVWLLFLNVFIAFKQAASVASGYGVRINALCPSFVQTELFSNGLSKLGQFSHLADETLQFAEKIGTLR